MAQYRAVVGIDYPPNKRVEAGEIVSDLPEKSVTWLLSSGMIEELNGKSSKKIKEEIKEEVVEPVVEAKIKAEDGFKPNAKDGDGDGFVQDGTKWQRPVESENK
jgi:hypothetical protein